MPVKGFSRYLKLFSNIQNPFEYLFNKGQRFTRSLVFTTKPFAIHFTVPESLYQVFKEIFMADVYNINYLTKILPEKPVVIDIGANAGYFDVLLLSKINRAKIFAYEPLPYNIDMIKSVVKQNVWLQQNLSFNQKAVTGIKKEKLELFMENTGNNQVVASVFPDFDTRNNSKISVPCISLTDIIEQNNMLQIDLLKMDCEGSEYDIIYNTDKNYVQRIKIMVAEVHDLDSERNNIRALTIYLKSLAFSVKYSSINNACYALEAIKE